MRISDWSSDVCSSDLCMRTNGIVESVLGLARRERAQPENIDLVVFVRRFLDDYLETIPPDLDDIKFSHGVPTLPVLVDPRHLQQVLTVLVQNSLRYGRMPGQPARVILRSEEHTSELPSRMRLSYAVFCLKKKKHL